MFFFYYNANEPGAGMRALAMFALSAVLTATLPSTIASLPSTVWRSPLFLLLMGNPRGRLLWPPPPLRWDACERGYCPWVLRPLIFLLQGPSASSAGVGFTRSRLLLAPQSSAPPLFRSPWKATGFSLLRSFGGQEAAGSSQEGSGLLKR